MHFTCPLCQRTTHHPQDVAHQYCPCCGGPFLPKLCAHRRPDWAAKADAAYRDTAPRPGSAADQWLRFHDAVDAFGRDLRAALREHWLSLLVIVALGVILMWAVGF